MVNIEKLAWWNWWLLCFIAAAILYGVSRFPLAGGIRSISQEQFEQDLKAEAIPGSPVFVDLVVVPARNGHEVRGDRLVQGRDGWYRSPFIFYARVPYRPVGSAVSELADVRGLLAVVQSDHPDIAYTYAWWRAPWLEALWYAGGSMLVIGAIWPILMRRLIASGFGRNVPPVAEARTESGRAATLAEGPIGSIGAALDMAPRELVESQGSVKALNLQPQEEIREVTEEKAPEYEGEFYPTAAHPTVRQPSSEST